MKRSFLMKAWRMAAIYRCCLRHEADPEWALMRVREIYPDGSRDREVDNWFTDMAELRQHHRPQTDFPQLAIAA